jgi:hypothetical protein
MDSIFDFAALLAMLLIPLVAIIGGITAGIIKSHHRQKLLELAQRERIAAIERGVDPKEIAPPSLPPEVLTRFGKDFSEVRQLRRSQLLMIWGLISAGFGAALSIMLVVLEDVQEPGQWAGGMMFVLIGLALVISSRVVRPDPEDVRREKERWMRFQNGETQDSLTATDTATEM